MSELHQHQCYLSIECGAKIFVEITMRARTGMQARLNLFLTQNAHVRAVLVMLATLCIKYGAMYRCCLEIP
ncbi:MAG: hypothetical protein EF813_02915 [Methanosarcinales archaeon]|nr:MAG: hypothetical protein EF813_02915 [Methanosarcinales archaeon]